MNDHAEISAIVTSTHFSGARVRMLLPVGLAAAVLVACGSKSTSNPGNALPDAGSDTNLISGTDGGSTTDGGGNTVDSGGTDASSGGTDAGSGGTDSGGDATPSWAPSNFSLSALNGLTPTPFAVLDDCTADTDDGTWNCSYGDSDGGVQPVSQSVTMSGIGGNALVWYLSSLTIAAGNTLTFTGGKPAIVYVTGAVQIGGPIVVNSGAITTTGLGLGGSGYTSATSTVLGGGGGGGYCGAGGAGLGVDGGANPAGGGTYGGPTLVPLLGGSIGGAGNSYAAGAGGGALQITSATSITVIAGGSILAGGLGGNGPDVGSVGNGGGSGGAILLEAPSVAIGGNLSANGGGGSDPTGTSGSNAGLLASPATGGGNGGEGGFSTVSAGAAGATTPGAAGGGGVGFIRINTTPTNLTIAATITPSIDGGCASIGAL